MSDSDARPRVPVPADVELPDKLLAGLTARQAVITAIAVLVIWAGFEATRRVLPLPVFAALAAPVAVAATALAIGQRDGLTLDRLLAAAWRQARSPRRMAAAPEGVPAPPGWVAAGLARQAGPLPAPVTPPWAMITPDGSIGLGDGAAAVCAVSTVNFALRSPAEQDALTAAYGRWLHSLTGPVQILIRTGHADLATAVTRLRENAPALPHPALEHAALAHAGFLAGLAATRQVLTRQVLLVTREPGRGPGPPGGAAGRAAQRAAEAARLLASADLQARPLDGAQVTALLAAACDPGGPHRAQRLGPARPPHPPAAAAGRQRRACRGRAGRAAGPARRRGRRPACGHRRGLRDDPGGDRVPGRGRARVAGTADLLPGRRRRVAHRAGPPAVAVDRLGASGPGWSPPAAPGPGQGRLDDPQTEAAAEDARTLAYQVARGKGKLFRLGLYLTVHGTDPEGPGRAGRRGPGAGDSLLSTAPATYRSLQGWVTTLPAGTDALKLRPPSTPPPSPRRSRSAPRTCPATRPRRTAARHLVRGIASGPGLVAWDRWACETHNSVTLATGLTHRRPRPAAAARPSSTTPGTAPRSSRGAGPIRPDVPPGELAWYPPSPVPPARHALHGEPRPGNPAMTSRAGRARPRRRAAGRRLTGTRPRPGREHPQRPGPARRSSPTTTPSPTSSSSCPGPPATPPAAPGRSPSAAAPCAPQAVWAAARRRRREHPRLRRSPARQALSLGAAGPTPTTLRPGHDGLPRRRDHHPPHQPGPVGPRHQIPASQAQPGNLVFFDGSDGTPTAPGHVGIILNPAAHTMIDAYATGYTVEEDTYGLPSSKGDVACRWLHPVAVGAYGGAVLTKVRDDAADATVGIGRRLLQRVFGRQPEDEPLPAPLAALAADPGDADALGLVRWTMRQALEADAAMLEEVGRCLHPLRA